MLFAPAERVTRPDEDCSVPETSKSLLLRAGGGDETAWHRFDDVYRPMIRGWLGRFSLRTQDAEDLEQDVLTVVARHLRDFSHAGRVGAFRNWLRTVTVNCARQFWRQGRCRPQAAGGSELLFVLDQLEDPDSDLSREWNTEHDAHVVRSLLRLMEAEFEPMTVRVFRMLALENRPAADVAAEVGMSLAAVWGAKSRVLRRLREEAEGLID
jgi:RNA polymerase sigma-70 factor (ECF subfamily)